MNVCRFWQYPIQISGRALPLRHNQISEECNEKAFLQQVLVRPNQKLGCFEVHQTDLPKTKLKLGVIGLCRIKLLGSCPLTNNVRLLAGRLQNCL